MAGIGHNNGQTLEAGASWRRFAWAKARRDLMPTLPIEVVRVRVKRAAELGLPYKTYAGIKAASGHDLIGFMFSTNALQMIKTQGAMPDTVVRKLEQIVDARRVALTHPPHLPDEIAASGTLDAAYTAPSARLSWSQMRDHLKGIARSEGAPADRFPVIGDTFFEREWAEAMQAAGYLPGPVYCAGAERALPPQS